MNTYDLNQDEGILYAIYNTLGMDNYKRNFACSGKTDEYINDLVEIVMDDIKPNKDMFIYASGIKPDFSVSAGYHIMMDKMTNLTEFISALMKGSDTKAEHIYCPQILPIEIGNNASIDQDNFKINGVEYKIIKTLANGVNENSFAKQKSSNGGTYVYIDCIIIL